MTISFSSHGVVARPNGMESQDGGQGNNPQSDAASPTFVGLLFGCESFGRKAMQKITPALLQEALLPWKAHHHEDTYQPCLLYKGTAGTSKRDVKVLIMVDACHAGGMFSGLKSASHRIKESVMATPKVIKEGTFDNGYKAEYAAVDLLPANKGFNVIMIAAENAAGAVS